MDLRTSLNEINDIQNFNKLFANLKPKIAAYGGRRIVYQPSAQQKGAFTGSVALNDLVKKILQLEKTASTKKEALELAILQVKSLDDQANMQLCFATSIQIISTKVRSWFSSFFFDRKKALAELSQRCFSPIDESAPSACASEPLIFSAVVSIPALNEESRQMLDRDPFIHGTSSSILSLLPHTEQSLISLHALLMRGYAPFSGEIELGGTTSVISKSCTAFGRIHNCGYNLGRVLNYAVPLNFEKAAINPKALCAYFLEDLQKLQLTKALLYLQRLRQAGYEFFQETGLDKDEIKKDVRETQNSIKKYYYLLLLVSKFGQPIAGKNWDHNSFIQGLQKIINRDELDLSWALDADRLLPLDLQLKGALEDMGVSLQPNVQERVISIESDKELGLYGCK